MPKRKVKEQGKLKTLFSDNVDDGSDREEKVLLFGAQLTSPVKRALDRTGRVPLIEREFVYDESFKENVKKMKDSQEAAKKLVLPEHSQERQSSVEALLHDLSRSQRLDFGPQALLFDDNDTGAQQPINQDKGKPEEIQPDREQVTVVSDEEEVEQKVDDHRGPKKQRRKPIGGASQGVIDLSQSGDGLSLSNANRSVDEDASGNADKFVETTFPELAEQVHAALFGPLRDEVQLFDGKLVYPTIRFSQTLGVDIPIALAGRLIVRVLPGSAAHQSDIVVRFIQQNPQKDGMYADMARQGKEIVWAVGSSSLIELPERFLGHTLNGVWFGKKWLKEKGI